MRLGLNCLTDSNGWSCYSAVLKHEYAWLLLTVSSKNGNQQLKTHTFLFYLNLSSALNTPLKKAAKHCCCRIDNNQFCENKMWGMGFTANHNDVLMHLFIQLTSSDAVIDSPLQRLWNTHSLSLSSSDSISSFVVFSVDLLTFLGVFQPTQTDCSIFLSIWVMLSIMHLFSTSVLFFHFFSY